MPQLLGLPNETLLQIIASTHVEDIESFSSCNKQMRLLFGPVLQLHVERKRRYSKIELGRPHTHVRSPHAVMLLRDVLESPMIAHYPTEIVVRDCVEELGDWPEERGEEGKAEISAAITQCTGMLSADLNGCPYLGSSEPHRWKQEICEGDEDTTAAFLVALFPNLKSITISDAKFRPDRLVRIVSEIAVAHRKFPESFHPLRKLNSVRLERCCASFQARYDVLGPFAELQSVRKMTGKMVLRRVYQWGNDVRGDDDDDDEDEDEDEGEDEDEDGGEDGGEDKGEGESEDTEEDELEDEEETQNSDNGEDEVNDEDEYEYKNVESGGGITHLSFEDSDIDVQSFKWILRGTKGLRKFGYNYRFLCSADGFFEWEPATILRSLLLYAGHSLVSLDLTGNKGSWDIRVGDSPYFANSPRHFQVLKWLYVQDGIFAEEIDGLTCARFVKNLWGTNKGTTWRNYRMVDILPASLEELTLFPSFDHRDQITNAFEGFPKLRNTRLPRLKAITLAGGLQLDKSVKLACKKVGTNVFERLCEG